MFTNVFQGRKIWLSGHTGFKGSWLAEWLLGLGAHIHGFSLPPSTDPSLFEQLNLSKRLEHEIGDVRDLDLVAASVRDARPDFIFHLAAQPLVRLSYREPVETYAANVMGTVHVLEAMRQLGKPCAAIMVTTDKCYENRGWIYGYREEDSLGGYDPYSSSKGMAEIAISAYRRSFFKDQPTRVASARAGNVIGGGDWAADRIVPDCVRALQRSQPIPVRNPSATRPWQHVLEPLSGYLWLAALLFEGKIASPLDSAFNFGPSHGSNRTVEALVQTMLEHWPGEWKNCSDPRAPHEADLLQLSIDKAHALLGWAPVWDFAETVRHTVLWYREAQALNAEAAFQRLTQSQIDAYCTEARAAGLPWADD